MQNKTLPRGVNN